MKFKQTINSFSAWTVDRLTGARRATLTTLATFLIAMTAQTAWAWSGSGTSSEPYQISSTTDLNQLAANVNSGTTYENTYFIVTADIAYTPSDNNFTPIGAKTTTEYSKPFKGHFDGNGKTISGIRINRNGDSNGFTDWYQGLFGMIEGGEVKNVILDDANITGNNHCGGIVGWNNGGTISNCKVTNTVYIGTADNQDVDCHGGIAGSNDSGVISGCVSSVQLTVPVGTTGFVNFGGIAGTNDNGGTLRDNLVIDATIPVTSGGYYGAITGDYINESCNYYVNCKVGDTANATNVGSWNNGSPSDVKGARKALTVTFPTNGTPSGTATEYNVSGITGYTGKSGGSSTTENNIILYNDGTTSTYYSGAGESVIFLYNYDGYQVSVKDADAGKVDFTKDIIQTSATNIYHNHTFNMPAKNVTITATDVWGVAGGKDGSTEANAYVITSTAGLDLLAQNVNAGSEYYGKYFELGADITYTHTTDWDDATSTENNFTPIGSEYPIFFGGHFDGKNHTISGIRIYSNDGNQGLFGNGGVPSIREIKNIKLANARIKGKSYVGGIVGQNENYTITNCHIASDVAIIATNYNCGGIAGSDGGTNSSIIGCTSAATVSGNNYVGGIAGQIIGSITDCFVTGATVSGTAYVGAIAGFKNTDGTLKNNYYYNSTVNGSAATDAGCNGADVAGARKAYTVTLGTNANGSVLMDGTCTAHGSTPNAGDISIKSFADNSGILYTINGHGSTTYAGATETIKLKYTGTVAEGCVVGYSVNDGEATAGNTITMPAADATITEVDMALWGNGDGDSEATAYVITTTEGLDLLAQKVNAGTDYSGKYFKLGADIKYNKNTANNYTPIGDDNNYFYGSFDGNGKTISGINIYNSDATYQGVFGYLKGTVKNLVVSDCSIVAWRIIGAIAGQFLNGTIENCIVSNNVTLSGSGYVGGIVGSSSNGTIKGCVSAAAITGTISYHTGPSGIDANHLGGIAGAALTSSDSKVTDNLFTGAITGDLGQYIGAIVGENPNGGLDNNLYTSTGLGGIGIASGDEKSTTGADVAGARKALTVTFPTNGIPSGTATEYNVSGITGYTGKSGYDDTTVNNIILYNDGTTSTYYSGAGESVIFLYNYDGYQVSVTDADQVKVDFTKDIKQTDATHIYHNHTFTMPAKAVTITATDVWGVAGGKDGSTADKAYTITTTEGLDLLAQKVDVENNTYQNTFFKLGADIEYDGTANNFTPISYIKVDENDQPIERPFRGHFDGNGKTISGINLNNSDVDNHGIFGYLYGTVKNLVVSNCSIVADHNIGAIVGVLYGTIENCHVGSDVTLSGHSHVGGIAGWCADATIKGCTSAATITGINSSNNNADRLGGIVGATLSDSKVIDNLFTGTISDNLKEYIGAIVGENPNGGLDNNLYTSTGLGGRGIASGSEKSTTGADGAGAHKAVEIIAAEGVTITPTGEKTTYNVSGITAYTDNNFIGYDSKLYAGATTRAKLSITYTVPEGYIFDGIDAGEGVKIILNEGVYNLAVPASDVTVDVVYQAIIYNITYKGVEDEGVTFTEDNPEAYTVADESFALNNPSREGYLFMGWTYEGQDEPTKTVTIAMGSTGDKTFTANWEEFVETEVETAVINEAAKEVEITKVMVPKGETKAVIPATVNGYTVTNIAKGAFYYKTGEDHVQDIFLPDTKRLINIEEGALIFDDLMEPTLHVPLELLSDYANMPGLKIFFEADKIQAMAVAPNKFWTFSCGIDVKVPEGVKVYTCRMNDDKTAVLIHELTDDELGGVIKANNGVLLSSARGKYPFIVNHATATEVGKSYENNLLEPVLKTKNYASGEYYVLMDNEFHPIIANGSEVPACKAVLHWASSAKARLEIIVGDDVKTAINGIAADEEGGEWYTISGQRIDKPTKKGLYIKNGKKVIIK